MTDTTNKIEILLVEDNPGDVVLTMTALKDIKILNNISVAIDGEEALAMLNHESGYEDIPVPDFILLDLNLPKVSGQEVLENIKNDDENKNKSWMKIRMKYKSK